MPNRVHIVIPKELTDEIDSLVSERSRSAFICNAVREKLVVKDGSTSASDDNAINVARPVFAPSM